jgi:NTE family protein
LNERVSARRGSQLEQGPRTGSEAPGSKGLPARIASEPRQLSKTHRQSKRMAFDRVVLLLQGGGALGAYQGGVYEALAEANLHPDWVAGISIGAINATIIAGNPPNRRVGKLREFWERITHALFEFGAGANCWRA